MAKERFKIIPACHLILMRGKEVLLLRRFNTGYEDGNYSVPAGHVDGNETMLDAMRRESLEETGLDFKKQELKVSHVMHRKKDDEERIDFFITSGTIPGTPYIAEPDKCDDLRWFNIDALPENIIPYVRKAIECIQKKEFYSEFGWNSK